MSAVSPLARPALPRPRPRFVLTNYRMPRVEAECTLCGTKIERSYVRELHTGHLYCDQQCLAGHQRIVMGVGMAS